MARNTAANVGGAAVLALIALVTTPVLLQHLGAAAFGVWLLATTLTFDNGVLRLGDLGLQPATVKLVAEARGEGDDAGVDHVASTALAILGGLGVALGALLVVAAPALLGLFNVEADLQDAGIAVFAVVGATVVMDLPSAGLLAVVEGAERFVVLRSIEVGSRVLWAVASVVAVLSGRGVVAVAVAYAAAAVVRLLAAAVAAHLAQRGLRLRPGNVRRSAAGRLVPFGGRLLVLKLLQTIYRQMDRIILGVALTAAAVAEYEVAYKVHTTAAILLTVAPTAFLPRASYLVGREGASPALRRLYLQGTRWSLVLCLPVMLAAVVWAGVLVVAWVGPEYQDVVGDTRLFLLYPVLGIFHAVGSAMLVGLARVRQMILLNALSVGTNLVVSVSLVGSMGVTGVVLGTLAGFTVQWVPFLRLLLRQFHVALSAWLREVVVPALPGAVVTVLLALVTLPLTDRLRSIWSAGAAFAVLCAVAVAASAALGMDPAGRRRLIDQLRRRGAATGGPS